MASAIAKSNNKKDDIAATYDEMDASTDWDAAQASERLGES